MVEEQTQGNVNSPQRNHRWLHPTSNWFKQGILNPAIPFLLLFLLSLLLFSQVKIVAGDDEIFAAMHLHYSLPQYILMRYQTWSGRLFIEALLYYFTSPAFFLWKWLCALSITASAFVLYTFVHFGRNLSRQENFIAATLSCCSFFLINSAILSPSVFWVTGALNYLIPTTLGLIAFLPFFFSLQKENYQPRKTLVLYLAAAILTALGEEQVSLCLVGFSVLVIVYLFYTKRKISKSLWIILAVTLVFQIFSFTAPGNELRAASEISRWFPGYNAVSIATKLNLSAFFIINTLINQTYLLFLLLWLILGILLWKKAPTINFRILSCLSFLFAGLMALRFVNPMDTTILGTFSETYAQLFNFQFLMPGFLSRPDQWSLYLLWGIGLLLIPVSIGALFKKTKTSFFYIFLFLAAMASLLVITFSPTLFPSGGRTSLVSDTLLILLILLLLRENGLLKAFAAPILAVALFRVFMLYSTWRAGGFQLWYGVLDTNGIPFMVLGK